MEPLPLTSGPTKPWHAVGASFRRWPIQRKLFVAFLTVFAATFMLNWAASGWLLNRVVQRLVEKELESSTLVLENLVKTSIDASINSYLRGIAEKNSELVAALHARVQAGEISEATAQRHAAEVLLTQRIGNSGYIYVLDGKGIIRVHPKAELRGADLTKHAFIREQLQQHNGYLEYQWANPGEVQSRPKALYMTYFAPWDWIISVSSYRDEFRHLVKTSDFRARILDLRFGETGYPYLMDTQGTLLVHPSLEGKNILRSRDSGGREFIREMVAKRNGRIIYPWQNPDESVAREKLVVFRYIPEMDWIVASSSYLEEFNRAADQFAWIMGSALLTSLLLAGAATFVISRSLTRPLMNLSSRVALAGRGSLELLPVDSTDEVGELAATINGFLTRIQHSQNRLEASELRHRRLFENAVEGIFQSTPEGRFITANPSMAHILGYANAEAFLQQIGNNAPALYVDPCARAEMWQQLSLANVVRDFETEFRMADGRTVWVKINARAVRSGEHIDYLEGFLTDVTEDKLQREALLAQQRQLESRVQERTLELRQGIARLERHNKQIADLHEFTELLQLCTALVDCIPVFEAFLPRLFPDATATLFLMDGPTGLLMPFLHSADTGFTPQSCCALREGKPYVHAAEGDCPRCVHLEHQPGEDSLCLPVMAGGEVHGLIQVLGREVIGDEFQRHSNNVAEHLGLAITTLKLQVRLREQSIRDPLTGLYNRRYLDEVAPRELQTARRQGQPLGLAMFDIDHFKRFNDEHDHDAGDEVLCQLTRFVVTRLRASDLAFRIGGEEFLLLLPQSNTEDILAKMERLRQHVAHDLQVEHGHLRLAVTISVGVASFAVHGNNLDDLLKAADAAMYHAKATGRNRVEVASPLRRAAATG